MLGVGFVAVLLQLFSILLFNIPAEPLFLIHSVIFIRSVLLELRLMTRRFSLSQTRSIIAMEIIRSSLMNNNSSLMNNNSPLINHYSPLINHYLPQAYKLFRDVRLK